MKLIKDNLFLILILATLLLFFIHRTTSKELAIFGKLINNPNKTFILNLLDMIY